MKRQIILLCSLCLVLPLASARAEEDPARGRRPDGRAYRTDADGIQIVDYIAELELSVEALNRRIKGLESELEEKQQELDRSGRGTAAKPKLVERNLIAAAPAAPQKCAPCVDQSGPLQTRLNEANTRIETLTADLRAAEHAANTRCDPCVDPSGPVRTRLDDANRQIETLKADLRAAELAANTKSASCADQNEAQRTRLDDAGRQIETLKADLRAAEQAATTKCEAVRSAARAEVCDTRQAQELSQQLEVSSRQVQTYESELTAVRAALRQQEVRLQEKEAEMAALRAKNADAVVPAQVPVLAPPSAAAPLTVAAEAIPAAVSKAQFSPERLRAAAAVRSELQSELNRLQGLSDQRNLKYKQYQSQTRAVQFRMTPLASSGGKSLAAVRQEMESADLRQLSALRGEVKEMQAKAQDDVAMMERLMRVR